MNKREIEKIMSEVFIFTGILLILYGFWLGRVESENSMAEQRLALIEGRR